MTWFLFFLVAAIIVVAGSKLSVYADILAIKLKLSRSAIGVLLVSIVTTLPEITTTLSAICKVDAPNMALGNNFGSILFNLSIIGICDIVFRQGGILRHIHNYELRPAVCSLALILIAALGLVFTVPVHIGIFSFGLGSLAVILVYIACFKWIHSKGAPVEILEEAEEVRTTSTFAAALGFIVCSVAIVASGISLAVLGSRLAESAGLSRSFVGTLFLAVATSLPELTVGISSVRRGAFDLMLGNVMGANMLNVLVIALADIFYLNAALNVPGNLGWSQIFAAFCAVISTIVAIAGILRVSRERESRFIDWRSASIMGLHIICLVVIFNEWL